MEKDTNIPEDHDNNLFSDIIDSTPDMAGSSNCNGDHKGDLNGCTTSKKSVYNAATLSDMSQRGSENKEISLEDTRKNCAKDMVTSRGRERRGIQTSQDIEATVR
jgi:hypothetical protein